MAMFMQNQVRQDDPRMMAVYGHFESNLRKIIEAGHRQGVKLAVGTVASNLKDCAPFASQHRPGLGTADLAEWGKLYQSGSEAGHLGHFSEALGWFQQAGRIDDTYADLQYLWGSCCLGLGRDTEGLLHLIKARDEDALRFRADSRINEIIRHTALGREQEGVVLVDGAEGLARQSPHGVTGDEMLYEHVHLRFEGNYWLARAFAEALAKLLPELSERGGRAVENWPSSAECAKRLASTDWNQYEAERAILSRLTDAPFTGQLNHQDEYEKLRTRLEQLRLAIAPSGLLHAEEVCRSALAAAPEDWVLNKELASVREQLGDYAGAVGCWRSIVKSMPHYVEGWQALGRALLEQKQEEEARAAFEQALRLEPDSAATLVGLAQILARQGKPAEAIGYYERVLKLKPYWGPAHLGLGQAYEALSEPIQAERHFRRALQDRVYTPAALKALGGLCFDKGWLNEAATNFTDALKLDPLDAATEVNLGLTLGLMGRSQEAQNHYAEALRLDPNLAEAHVRLGFELGRQGRDAAAMDHFAKAVQLKPELLEARLDLGIALMNQHREKEALDQFQEVLKRSPTNAIALRYLRRLGQKRDPESGPRNN